MLLHCGPARSPPRPAPKKCVSIGRKFKYHFPCILRKNKKNVQVCWRLKPRTRPLPPLTRACLHSRGRKRKKKEVKKLFACSPPNPREKKIISTVNFEKSQENPETEGNKSLSFFFFHFIVSFMSYLFMRSALLPSSDMVLQLYELRLWVLYFTLFFIYFFVLFFVSFFLFFLCPFGFD